MAKPNWTLIGVDCIRPGTLSVRITSDADPPEQIAVEIAEEATPGTVKAALARAVAEQRQRQARAAALKAALSLADFDPTA